MKRKIIIISAASIVILGIIIIGSLSKPSFNSDHAIPEDAIVAFYLKNNDALLETISSENRVWNGISFTAMEPDFLAYLLRFNALLKNNPHDMKIFNGKKSYFSLHYRSQDSLSALLVVELKSAGEKRNVSRIIKHITEPDQIKPAFKYKKTDCFAVQTPTGIFFYALQGNVFLASSSGILLQEAIDNLNSKGEKALWNNAEFQKSSASWGQWVNGNMYVSYPKLEILSVSEKGKKYATLLRNMHQFAQSSSMDVHIKNDFWTFNGYTASAEGLFISFFENQKGASSEVVSYLPDNTDYFFSFGFSNPTDLLKQLEQYNGLIREDYQEELKKFNQKYKIDLHSDFAKFTSNIICFAWINNEPVLCIKIKNNDQATNFMHKISAKDSHFDSVVFVDMLLGNEIINMKSNYWTIHGQYLLIAESSAVFNTISDKRKSLKAAPHFKNISELLTDNSNITFYANNKGISRLFSEFQGRKNSSLEAFNGFMLQFNAEDGLFYTHAVLEQNQKYKYPKIENAVSLPVKMDNMLASKVEEKEMESLQTNQENEETQIDTSFTTLVEQVGGFVLEGKMILSPSPVYNHRLQRVNFVVFDDKKNAYLIDDEEGILWRKKLPELPLGAAFEIDYYANGKIQYLFNSPNYIFGVDVLGDDLKNFPIKLKNKAQNSATVFDFHNNKNYAIPFVDEKGSVQSLDKTEKTSNNWSVPMISGNVSTPVQYCAKDNNRFIIVVMDDGAAHIYNMQGKEIISSRNSFQHNIGSDFYINRTNKKGILLTTDNTGDLIYISASGAVQKTDFPTVSNKHYFLYEDLTNNGHHDFIYLDDKELKVYDRFKNNILSYTFSQKPETKPVFFKDANKGYLLVFVGKESKIYLFDKNGVLKVFEGAIPPAIAKIKNNEKPKIITTKDKEIVFYDIN
ncbi:MAG: hypothetical protein LBH92_05340 [Bacteroidales bacterium]|jgi:hypothetical protein|nr:hypothetical protein [Bacteroidales bacterium]